LLAAEVLARQREELNGLYVAMSRAKERLVFSATEPSRRAAEASWWERVEPLALTGEPGASAASELEGQGHHAPPITLKALAPLRWPEPATPARAPAMATPSPDTEATRLGKAVHRVLEWATATATATATASAHGPATALSELAHAAAIEFDTAAETVAQLAHTILRSPACTKFFTGAQLRWAGNEVSVSDAAEVLRIDRLVCLEGEGGPVWWVLDYKLQHAPQELAAYRAQMLRYREAVRRAQPGAAIRCAFITGAGAVIEID
jgi:ATP-dependent helicase/nuclease subunit A